MKTHLILTILILGCHWAQGTVQTSLNQDKPPYVSVQNVNITLNGYYSASQTPYSPTSQVPTLTGLEQYNGSLVGGSTSGGGSWTYLYYDIPYSEYDWGQNYSWSWSNPNSYIQTFSLWQVLYPPYDETSTNDGPFCLPKVICDYYYFHTNWVRYYNLVPSPNDTHYTLEQSTAANTSITLHTGGKSTSRQRNVFALNGWGASQMEPVVFFDGIQFSAGSWCGCYVGGASFPPQSITLGSLGALDANGNEYAGLPDNATVDVTPMVAGAPRYVFGIGSVQKFSLTITANGTNLSTSTPEICVGQQVNFAPSWSPSTPPYVNSVQHWSLPGGFVNDYEYGDDDDASGTYFINSDLLTDQTTSCWFVNQYWKGQPASE